jgi:A/G-specific adenine glycosylase
MLKKLVKWSNENYYDLPWRTRRSLYHTLVSEIMLQQTTVSTVVKHFDRFLKVYPSLQELAASSEEEVCSHWQGLGYYRRARNLRKAAVALVEEHGGHFPMDEVSLKKIPGIGEYTSAALIAIGANQKALAVDANIERVVARLFALKEEKGIKLQKRIREGFHRDEFSKLEKDIGYRELNESLMDLGRVYCQAKKADCFICPLKSSCQSLKQKINPLTIPITSIEKAKKESFELELLRVVVFTRGKVLASVRQEGLWLSGQIEIPTFIINSQDTKLKQYPKIKVKKALVSDLPSIKTAITKYKITNKILLLSRKEFQELMTEWGIQDEYKYYLFDGQKHHFSTTTLKTLAKIGVTK